MRRHTAATTAAIAIVGAATLVARRLPNRSPTSRSFAAGSRSSSSTSASPIATADRFAI